MEHRILFLYNSHRMYRELAPHIEGIDDYLVLNQPAWPTDSDVANLQEKVQELRPDAVVALPGTATVLSPHIPLPIVPMHPSSLDLLVALFAANSSASGELNYIGYYEPAMHNDIDRYEALLGRRIVLYTYTSYEERAKMIEYAVRRGVRVAAVTSETTRVALERVGGRGIMLTRSNNTVMQAIRTAHAVIDSKKMEAEQNVWLKRVLDNLHDGLLSIEPDGAVGECNTRAAACLGLAASEIRGKKLRELGGNRLLARITESVERGGNHTEVVEINGKVLLIGCVWIEDGRALVTLRDDSEIVRLKKALSRDAAANRMLAKFHFEDIVGRSPAMRHCVSLAGKYASSAAPVLLIGDTGVGKEMFAQSIHNSSPRQKGPFVAINCATIPEGVLESELFGYEGGSFTGARREGKRGLFEIANGGTMFLDEIGEMPMALQARLLRVLQNMEIMHIGGDAVIPVDVRVIAATNRNLEAAIEKNLFRRDLYYRIAMLTLHIPPLAARPEDIPLLAQHFLKEKSFQYGMANIPLDERMLDLLRRWHWRGNVRELESVIEKYVFLYHDLDEYFDDVFPEEGRVGGAQSGSDSITLTVGTMDEMQRQIIAALSRRYPVTRLAEVLDLSRTTLWRRMNRMEQGPARER